MTYAYVDGLSDVIVNDCCIERHIDRDALYGEEFDKAYNEMRFELHKLKK